MSNPDRLLVQADHSHQEEGLDLGHGSPQDRAHVVAHTGQQDAEQGDAHQGVAHAEQLSVPGPRGQVPKPWRKASHKTQSLLFIHRGERGEEPHLDPLSYAAKQLLNDATL